MNRGIEPRAFLGSRSRSISASSRSARRSSARSADRRSTSAVAAGEGGLVHDAVRGVLADSIGQCSHHGLGHDVAPLGVEVLAHPDGVDLQALEDADGGRDADARVQACLGKQHPLGLPGPAVALVSVDHRLGGEVGIGAHEPGQAAHMLGQFGVALVGHGDAADRARVQRLAELSDLGALQFVDLVADLGDRRRDHRQQADELGQAVARREPRDRGTPSPSRRANDSIMGPARSPQNSIEPRPPPSSTSSRRGRPCAEPLDVPVDLGGPDGGLEAEGDGQPGLTVGTSAHDGVAVQPGEVHGGGPRPAKLPFDDVAPRWRMTERRPGVGDVLHRGAVVDPLAGTAPAARVRAHG